MKTVTLDALIPREDFEIISDLGSNINTRNKTTLSIEDLKYDSFFFSALRKPIFQRETNEWEPEKIFGMIESFVNGELVPAIILWRNQNGYIFVIDGAHRLSSLGAWINDDYGDGPISLNYFGNYVTTEQRNIATRTRELVNKKIASFIELQKIGRTPNITTSQTKKDIAKNLGALAIQVQWVDGDASKAEDSFLKINQSATKISEAELELIENRDKAFAISARAIVRAGKGYQYWSKFSEKAQEELLEIAKSCHKIMFGDGIYNSNDINSFPMGGILSSSLTLDVVTQTVKICNDISDSKNAPDGNEKNVQEYLKNTLEILEYINSTKPFSLGIHPFVYFYSDIGKHKIGSYYGFLLFIKNLISKKQINKFITSRKTFEEVIYKYSFIVQQIIRKYRQSKKAYTSISDYFFELMYLINDNPSLSSDEIIERIKQKDEFKYLLIEIFDNDEVSVKSNFSRGEKLQVKLNTFISSLPKCPICGGYLDNKSISVDHIERKQDGGTNALSNAQVTHLYCNTTYKN